MRFHELLETADRPKKKHISKWIRKFAKDENPVFDVLSHYEEDHDRLRPLVVIVHPGDMIEHSYGLSPEDARKVMAFSRANQNGTAEEIARWRREGADAVVIHRSSCTQFDDEWSPTKEFRAVIRDGWKTGSVVFGDDLDEAAKWIIKNLHVADRPHVYLAGAYSDPKWGCLTKIGRAIVKVIGPERVTVSKFSPPGNSPGPTWTPGT